MTRLFRELRPLPSPARLKGTVVEGFLRQLSHPTWFRLKGRDATRCRCVVTLLHGNEPSGSHALLRLLQEGFVPEVDVLCCVVRVDVACVEGAPFVHRMLPGERDQNRCFVDLRADDRPAQLARELLRLIRSHRPECVVDLHNTSGNGPAYSVATAEGPALRALTSHFSGHMVCTGLRLGTLMEALADELPCVTIECGGARQTAAHDAAHAGLTSLLSAHDALSPRQEVIVHRHPLRVELTPGARVAFASRRADGADVTLPPDADRLNFSLIARGAFILWLGPRGLSALRVYGESGGDATAELFEAREGGLYARVALRALMVTTDPVIAESDCLFYVVRLRDDPLALEGTV